MKAANQRKFDRQIRKWADRLWLSHWRITAKDMEKGTQPVSAPNFEAAAYVDMEASYKKAVVSVDERVWFGETPDSQNRSACHEMIHVANAPVSAFAEAVMDALPSERQAGFKAWWEKLCEENTEHWTNVMLHAYKEPQ